METNKWIAATLGCTEIESDFIDCLCEDFPSATQDDDLQADLEAWFESFSFGGGKPQLANYLITCIYERICDYSTKRGVDSDAISYIVNSICSSFICNDKTVKNEQQIDDIIECLKKQSTLNNI